MSQLMAYLQIAVGVALVVLDVWIPGTAAIGYAMIVGGVLSLAAGFLFAASQTQAGDAQQSPTYGFDVGNPVKGDSCLAIIYSNDLATSKPGHKIQPVYLSLFTSPRGFEVGDDDAKIISSQGQGLSCLLALGEGPIVDVSDIRANDEPLYDEQADYKVPGTPNGTATKFTIPLKRVEIDSVRLTVQCPSVASMAVIGNRFQRASGSFVTDGYVAGDSFTTSGFTNAANNGTFSIFSVAPLQITILPNPLINEAATATKILTHVPTLRGWLTRSKTELCAQGDGSKILFVKDITSASFVTENALRFSGPASVVTDAQIETLTTGIRPHAWFEAGPRDGSTTRCFINTQVPMSVGGQLNMTWTERFCTGFTPSINATTKELLLTFATAPATGTKITASFRRRRFPGLRLEWRRGGDNQLPIPDFNAVRNTVGMSAVPLVQDGVGIPFTTSEEVDDIIVDVVSGDGGFTQYDVTTGDRSGVAAQFKITWRACTANGTPTGPTFTLRDPSGIQKTGKSLIEFEMRGDQLSRKYYSVSIRNVLRENVDTYGDTQASSELKSFTRQRYLVTVTRTSKVNGSQYVLDAIALLSYQKVLDVPLLYPGIALLGIHAMASERLNGAAPRISCRVQGLSKVKSYSAQGGWVSTATNQANRVWAAIDLITNRRYGGGQQFTLEANIDTTSAILAADWCDALLTLPGNATEKRSVIDYVIDTRASLMEHVRNMLLPARVIPVLRGNVWGFVIDRDVTLFNADGSDAVPVVYDDTSAGRTMKDSMSCSHQPITSQITELQVVYYDRDDDFEQNEIWRAPTQPAADRRIERAQLHGTARITEATRYTEFLYQKQIQQGAQIGWAMAPGGLRLQAGDVVRVISQRLGIDFYVRVTKWEVDSSENMIVRVEAAQYIPAVYGQNFASQTILYRNPSAGQSATLGASGTVGANGQVIYSPRIPAVVRRVA